MNPTMKVDSLAAAQAADAAGEFVAFDQHAESMAAVARNKVETPRTDMIMGWAWQVTSPACREEMRQGIKNLERELAAANKELENERMRLVACGVIATSDTPESAKRSRDMHPDYRSASLTDVERRVDECIRLREELAAANKDLEILSIEKGQAREDAANWQLEAEAAYKQGDEAIRRLRQMHRSHSDSVQWYQNAVAQALKSLNALPYKLEF
jgi:hypothetical protein